MFTVHFVHISDRVLYSGFADRVIVPGVQGTIEVGETHCPIVSLLYKGKVMIRETEKEKEWKTFLIYQGLMRFDGEKLEAVVE